MMRNLTKIASASSANQGYVWTHLSGHWGDFLSALNDAVQVTAIVFGGGFAYFKYIHNRVFYESLLVDVEPALVTVNGQLCMQVTTRITNTGTYTMFFDMRCFQRATIRCMDAAQWQAACAKSKVDWGDTLPIVVDQLLDAENRRIAGTKLEPNEMKADTWVAPLPPGNWVAYRVVFRVKACRKWLWWLSEPSGWPTTKIVVI